MVVGQHEPVLVYRGANQHRPKWQLVGQVADRGTLGGALLRDLLLDIDTVGIHFEIPPRHFGVSRDDLHRLVKLVRESGRQVWMPSHHRLHRIVQAVVIERTVQRDIQLHRIHVVAILRGAGVKQQPLLQGGQRQNVSYPHIASEARRSAAG